MMSRHWVVRALLLKKESSRRRSWRPWRCTTNESAKALYEHWVRASIFTLPSRIDLQGMLPFCCDCYLEGMPLEAYKEYFGEKQGLLMAFKAHITTGYLMMSLFGIVVMLWWANTGSITGDGSVFIYACVVGLWSVLSMESWRRQERELALKWGMVGFEAEQARRPQFKGIPDMDDAVTGRPGRVLPAAPTDVPRRVREAVTH